MTGIFVMRHEKGLDYSQGHGSGKPVNRKGYLLLLRMPLSSHYQKISSIVKSSFFSQGDKIRNSYRVTVRTINGWKPPVPGKRRATPS
jgi:Ni/Co efflux regulator RcnB